MEQRGIFEGRACRLITGFMYAMHALAQHQLLKIGKFVCLYLCDIFPQLFIDELFCNSGTGPVDHYLSPSRKEKQEETNIIHQRAMSRDIKSTIPPQMPKMVDDKDEKTKNDMLNTSHKIGTKAETLHT